MMKKDFLNKAKKLIALVLCGILVSSLSVIAPLSAAQAETPNDAAGLRLYESVWYAVAPAAEGDKVTVDNTNGGYGFAQFTDGSDLAAESKLEYRGVLNIADGNHNVSCANLIFACQPGGPDAPETRWNHCNFNLGIKFDIYGNCFYVMLAGGSGVWIPMSPIAYTIEKGKDIPYAIIYDAVNKHVEFFIDGEKMIDTDLTAAAFDNNPIYEDALIENLKPCVAFGSDHSAYSVSGLSVAAVPEQTNLLTKLTKDLSAWGGDSYTIEGDAIHILDKTVYGYYRLLLDISDLTEYTFKGKFTVNNVMGKLACINLIYLGVPSPNEAQMWAGANSHQAIKLQFSDNLIYFIACEGSGNWVTSGEDLSVKYVFEIGKTYDYEIVYKEGRTTFILDGETILDADWSCDSTEYMKPQIAFGAAVIDAVVTDLSVLAAR